MICNIQFTKPLTNLTQIHAVFKLRTNVTKEPVTGLNSQDSQRNCNDFNCNNAVRITRDRTVLQLHLDRAEPDRVVTKYAHNRSQVVARFEFTLLLTIVVRFTLHLKTA